MTHCEQMNQVVVYNDHHDREWIYDNESNNSMTQNESIWQWISELHNIEWIYDKKSMHSMT